MLVLYAKFSNGPMCEDTRAQQSKYTNLVLVIPQSTVELSKFTELVALELVLSFWSRCRLQTISKGSPLQGRGKHSLFE